MEEEEEERIVIQRQTCAITLCSTHFLRGVAHTMAKVQGNSQWRLVRVETGLR